MNMVVLYQSKYGATKKYATWLGEALNCPVYNRKGITSEQIANYDYIIYGGPIYAGGVSGLDVIVKNHNKLQKKTIIVFTCGLSDPTSADVLVERNLEVQKSIPENFDAELKVFHLRGRMKYKKLQLSHRIIVALINKLNHNNEFMTSDEKTMRHSHGRTIDFMHKDNLQPIIDYVNDTKGTS